MLVRFLSQATLEWPCNDLGEDTTGDWLEAATEEVMEVGRHFTVTIPVGSDKNHSDRWSIRSVWRWWTCKHSNWLNFKIKMKLCNVHHAKGSNSGSNDHSAICWTRVYLYNGSGSSHAEPGPTSSISASCLSAPFLWRRGLAPSRIPLNKKSVMQKITTTCQLKMNEWKKGKSHAARVESTDSN